MRLIVIPLVVQLCLLHVTLLVVGSGLSPQQLENLENINNNAKRPKVITEENTVQTGNSGCTIDKIPDSGDMCVKTLSCTVEKYPGNNKNFDDLKAPIPEYKVERYLEISRLKGGSFTFTAEPKTNECDIRVGVFDHFLGNVIHQIRNGIGSFEKVHIKCYKGDKEVCIQETDKTYNCCYWFQGDSKLDIYCPGHWPCGN